MKRKGEGSCLLKQGKPRLELPRWSISISEWSCSCTATTTTLQGGTSEERALWMCSEARETLIFQPVWKSRDKLMLEKPTKIKGGRKREGGRKKLEILKRTDFYKLFEVEILNNSLDVTSSSEVLLGNTTEFSIFPPSFINKSVSQPWIPTVQM